MAKIPEAERERILRIAREVRRHVRKASGAYCPPQGLCGEASLALSTRLTRSGIPHEILGGVWLGPITRGIDDKPSRASIEEENIDSEEQNWRHHTWIVFPQYEDAILDVTADQYDRVPPIWFPAREDWYNREQKFDPTEIFIAAQEVGEKTGREAAPLIPLAGPHFRRPQKTGLKVAVRRHLRHPPKSCLCHRSKTVDKVRRGMIRRLS